LLDHGRIEVNTGAAKQKGSRFIERHTASKRSIFTNRVEAVDHRNDASCDRDLFAAESVGITATVPLFVMVSDDRNHGIWKIHTTEDLRPDNCVNLHLLKLCMCQWPGLVENVRWHRELADVVKQRTCFQRGDFIRTKPKHFAHSRRVNLHAPNVAMCCLIFRIDRGGESFGGCEMKLAQCFDLVCL
jgi:hypothetical protein